ncbi:hypothetical protein ABPG74_013330 [Tetrahymena malaccensis]
MNKQIKLQLKLGLYGLVFAISSVVIANLFQSGFDCNKGLLNGYFKNNNDNQRDPIIKKNYIIFIESLPLEWLFQNNRLLQKNQHQFHYDLLKKIGFDEAFLFNSTHQKEQNSNKTSNFFVQELKPSYSISNQDLVIEFLLGVSMQNLVTPNYNEVQFLKNFDSVLSQMQSNNQTCQFEDISFPNIELSDQRYKISELFQNFCTTDDLSSQGENILDSNFEFYYSGTSISQQIDIISEEFQNEINYFIQQIQKIKNKVQKDEIMTIVSLYQRNSISKKLCAESKNCTGFSLLYSPSFQFNQIEISSNEKVKIPDISATISLISGIGIPLLSQGKYLSTFLNSYIDLSNEDILELNANYQKMNLQQLSQYYEQVQQNSYIFNNYKTLYEKIQNVMRIQDLKYFIQQSQILIEQLVDQEFKKINPFQTQLLSVTTMIMILLVVFIWSCLIYFNSKLQLMNVKNYGIANLINQTDLILDNDDRVKVQILVNTFIQTLYFLAYFIQQIVFLNSPKCILQNPNTEKYLYQETIRDQFLLFICFLSIISLQASFFTYVQQIQEAKRYLFLILQIFKYSYLNQDILGFSSSSLQQMAFLFTEISIIALFSMMAQLRDEVKQKYGIIFFLKSQIIELRFIYDILKYIIFYFTHLIILQINILLQIDRNENMSKHIYPKTHAYQKVSFSYQTIVISSILLILVQIYTRKKYFMYRATKSEIIKTEERIETNHQITLQDV